MKKILLILGLSLGLSLSMMAEEKVLWQTGMAGLDNTNGTVPGQYETGLIVAPSAFAGLPAGTQMNIDISASAWAQVYIKNYAGQQIYPSIDLNVGQNISVALTKFQLEQIATGGLRIEASTGLDITKVYVNNEAFSGNFENALWVGNQTFTADWGGSPVQICSLEAAAVKAGDTIIVYYSHSSDNYSLMVNYFDAAGKGQDYNNHAWNYGDGSASFVVSEDFANLLATNNKGFLVKGASINVTQIDLVKKADGGDVKPVDGVLWQTGMTGLDNTNGTVPGAYQTGLIVAPSAFADLDAGTQMNIDINATAWAQVYLKNYAGQQIYPSIDLNVGQNISVVLTNFQLQQIATGGLRIEASTGLDITKVYVDTDAYSGNFKNALWIGNQTFTSDWGGSPVQVCALEAAEIKAGSTLTVYYTHSADDYSLMLNYFDADGKGQDYNKHAWSYGDGSASFVVSDEFANLLATNNKGFLVKGASINVTQIDLEKGNGPSTVNVITSVDEPQLVNVYNISGLLIYENVNPKDVIGNLPAGMYIVGNKKLVVR